MRRKILSAFLVSCFTVVFAQQDPYYTHFRYNMQSYNPGQAGQKEGHICFSGIAHRQWRDFNDGTFRSGTGETQNFMLRNAAPETYNANISSQLKFGKEVFGIGLSLMNDVAGYRAMTDVNLQLNYKIQLPSLGAEIGVGPSLGMRQFGFNNPRFRARQPGDTKIPMDDFTINDNKFNLGFGAFYKQENLSPTFKKLFGGISAMNILSPEYDLQTVREIVVPHFYAVAGAEYEINPTLLLEPTILIKAGGFPPQIDLNSTVLWNDMFRGGLAYRQWATSDAISLLFGYRNTALRMEVGYSYDITMSRVSDVSNGSHEIMVRYCHPIKTIDPKPKNIRRTPRFL